MATSPDSNSPSSSRIGGPSQDGAALAPLG